MRQVYVEYLLSPGRANGREHTGYVIAYEKKREIDRIDVDGAFDAQYYADKLANKYRQDNCQVIKQI